MPTFFSPWPSESNQIGNFGTQIYHPATLQEWSNYLCAYVGMCATLHVVMPNHCYRAANVVLLLVEIGV
jgi:hypothetical protein